MRSQKGNRLSVQAIDSAGKLYVTDLAGHRVYRVDVAMQVATVVAGNGTDDFSGVGGPATAAQMNAITATTKAPRA